MMDYEHDVWMDDPLAADCPWGGLGSYVLCDDLCEFDCPWLKSCQRIKKRAESERQGKAWRRLFEMEN